MKALPRPLRRERPWLRRRPRNRKGGRKRTADDLGYTLTRLGGVSSNHRRVGRCHKTVGGDAWQIEPPPIVPGHLQVEPCHRTRRPIFYPRGSPLVEAILWMGIS